MPAGQQLNTGYFDRSVDKIATGVSTPGEVAADAFCVCRDSAAPLATQRLSKLGGKGKQLHNAERDFHRAMSRLQRATHLPCLPACLHTYLPAYLPTTPPPAFLPTY